MQILDTQAISSPTDNPIRLAQSVRERLFAMHRIAIKQTLPAIAQGTTPEQQLKQTGARLQLTLNGEYIGDIWTTYEGMGVEPTTYYSNITHLIDE